MKNVYGETEMYELLTKKQKTQYNYWITFLKLIKGPQPRTNDTDQRY